ncbi:signal peptidase I [Streptomyces sp. WAC 06738]|uniref:signal peptidase I n=1 Tax=Streptomyces sp. WAC 06738 TaxID=2203210 RepID=UPI001F0BD6A9|nr:signal peptidase I [Streptomyces sp. WAC 06738]
MGDVAVSARSGHEDPEDRPGQGRAQQPAAGPPGSPPEQAAGGPADTAWDGAPRPSLGKDGVPQDAAAGAPGGPAATEAGAMSDGGDGSGGSSSGGEDADGGGAAAAGGKKQRSFWKELPILILVALVLALIIKTFLVQAFSIPSNSMQDTLQVGDRVLVDKLTPWFGAEPERGEVVVFHDPGGWLNEAPSSDSGPVLEGIQKGLSFIGLMPSAEEQDLIKRVIAVGGDTVECKGVGPVKVNGKALDETSYIFPGDTPCEDNDFGPVKVPEGKLWVMGDHRQDSLDSRYHEKSPDKGFVDEDLVVGRAIARAWPIDRWGTLPVPGTFDQPGLNAAAGAAPAALGLAGAVPLVLWRRRRLIRKADLND